MKALAVYTLCVLFFQVPEYQRLYKIVIAHTERQPTTGAVVQQIANPLTNLSSDAESHESKMAFRLTVPLLAHTLHLNFFGVLAVQFIVGLLLYWALLTVSERITKDRTTAFLLGLGASFMYYGGAFLHDTMGCLDTFGYATLMLMLVARKPLALFALTIIGGFMDERVLVASLIVVLWHSMRRPEEEVPQLRMPAITWSGSAIVVGWGAYAAIRLWLAAAYNLETYSGGVGFEPVYKNLQNARVALGFISGLESFWMIIFLALIVLVWQQRWKITLFFLVAVGPSIGGSFLIYDLTRSLSYVFPAVIIAVLVLTTYFTRNSIRQIVLTVTAFAILMPNYYFHGWILYSESLFEKTCRFLVLHYAL